MLFKKEKDKEEIEVHHHIYKNEKFALETKNKSGIDIKFLRKIYCCTGFKEHSGYEETKIIKVGVDSYECECRDSFIKDVIIFLSEGKAEIGSHIYNGDLKIMVGKNLFNFTLDDIDYIETFRRLRRETLEKENKKVNKGTRKRKRN